MEKKFSAEFMGEGHPKWEQAIVRQRKLYKKTSDIRSDFSRDYNRILHCKAYRRLKHKTQVFYATTNDHVCTRIEHVNHVASVSYSIANYLGLNTELTAAIALGHDLGHAPFGHEGEYILSRIAKDNGDTRFWHEKNSLVFVDKLETLPNLDGKETNLELCYAVRDGIISHCGEVNENAIFPRNEALDLYEIERPNQYPPFTWEACIVKIADKISYLGRDIEDALTLKILNREQLHELKEITERIKKVRISQINNTVLMHDFINNLCEMSSPENGILFSDKYLELINSVKAFNYKNIYNHPRLKYYCEYADLVLRSLFRALAGLYGPSARLSQELDSFERIYPSLGGAFRYWLVKYSDFEIAGRKKTKFANDIVYSISSEQDFRLAILHYISSMSDSFAVRLYGELTRF